jgi:hypothetical protein
MIHAAPGAQDAPAEDGGFDLHVGGFDLPPVVETLTRLSVE